MATMTNTKDDFSNLKNSTPTFRENVDETKDDLRHVANKAGHKVRDFISSASDDLSHVSEKMTSQIKENPVQSSVIALGVGFVLGALFRR